MKKLAVGLVLTLLVLAALSACAPGAAPDTIKIGVNAPLTGDIPKVGEGTKFSAEMWLEDIGGELEVAAFQALRSGSDGQGIRDQGLGGHIGHQRAVDATGEGDDHPAVRPDDIPQEAVFPLEVRGECHSQFR